MWYTRKGDAGSSGLFGSKERLPKSHPIYHALGTLDELNSWLGVCKAHSTSDSTVEALTAIQEQIFVMQAELAGADKHSTESALRVLEARIEELENSIPAPHSFLIPGATTESAFLDYARAVSRRAERAIVSAGEVQSVNEHTRAYSNRLSSYLYALARARAYASGSKEAAPSY